MTSVFSSPPQKVLIVNTFGIGDVLFTTPLISNLKKNFPDISISYLANRRTAPILEANPKIDRVFIYERDEYHDIYKKSKVQFWQQINKVLQSVKKEQFDCVFDLSLQGPMGFFMKLAGIKTRIGFNYKNRGRWLTTKVKLQGYENKHVVEYYLDLLRESGLDVASQALELNITPADQGWAESFLQDKGLAGTQPLIAVVPGGGASWGKDAILKRWAPEKYAKLADKIIEKFTGAIILLGDEKERQLCAQVAQSMKNSCIQLCGETSLGQLAALLARCHLAIVNDGGPLHMAVAVGAKTVSIFGPVDEQVYGPYPQDNHFVVSKDIACRPCYRRFRRAQCGHLSCITTIEVDEVFQKVEEAL